MLELKDAATALRSRQAPSAVVMVRPVAFHVNPLSADDNPFQTRELDRDPREVAASAYREVTDLVQALRSHGVTVALFEDSSEDFPDSVFPNNWFSTHHDGRVVLYPMYCPNRRGERRSDVVDQLRDAYEVTDVVDYSGLESQGAFLEGTGAMVLDHLERTAYIARSNRADENTARRFCQDLGYEPIVFDTADARGIPIYHTNVMMSVGTDVAMVGLNAVTDAGERATVHQRLTASGRTVIDLTHEQIDNFAGNVIELQGAEGPMLALSQRAYDSLRQAQRDVIELHVTLLPVPVPTIELSGGSVRCMIAGIHLPKRSAG